ncbi:hypothetical protein SAM23877_4736 [Streptomyces ambofaciens ATCC 23877]|uniref:Uncharacterized protein n=1 Tax=Streptomyces ambofaciens (strain ATCC 23877 / 3486 / DSM 40053 / JCM 4204 / NBRC 12836 / NRRL B-2516) TaxID=278992 RepID=A0A0K2AXZ6_STRA7|nr:hypothetical protein SAM23877_4736 [Streptomyces ambofaciens ATCC 23877]
MVVAGRGRRVPGMCPLEVVLGAVEDTAAAPWWLAVVRFRSTVARREAGYREGGSTGCGKSPDGVPPGGGTPSSVPGRTPPGGVRPGAVR